MSDVATQLASGSADFLPEDRLLEFVAAQRWFGSKTREPVGVRLLDHAVLRAEWPLLVEALAEIRFQAGMHEVYQLVIGVREGADPPGAVIAEGDGWTGYDGFDDPVAALELLHLLRRGATLSGGEGTFSFHTLGPLPLASDPPREVRPLGLEQSNSSIVLDDELIMKAYRRVEAGVNPELELLAFLTRKGFANIARLAGWWDYDGPLMGSTLGIVQRYVPDAVDGWTLGLREVPGDVDTFLARLRRLGEVIGTMHATLASDSQDPAFSPEEPSSEALGLLAATIDEEIEAVFLHLPEDGPLAPLAGHGDELRDLLRSLTHLGSLGPLIRHHGDLHLGQALWSQHDWVIVDFEGEPARSLPERRRKRSPLRDVAGMLRSFAYVASALELEHGTQAPPDFEERARAEFLEAYLAAAHDSGVLPDTELSIERLITIFELEKAVYELRYELDNRPDWVGVPAHGLLRLLERPLA